MITINRYNSVYKSYLPQPRVKLSRNEDILAFIGLVFTCAVLFALAIIK